MAISNNLVSKFVKATKNDTKNNKREKTVYGKMVKFDTNPNNPNDITWYAQIDGATHTFDGINSDNFEGLIPISRFTSDVNVNDKVVIMIKDHTAIVTGNVSSPSTDPVNVNGKIVEAVSKVETSSISLEDIRALWGSN